MATPSRPGAVPEQVEGADAYASFIPHDLHRRLFAGAARSEGKTVALRSVGLCLDIAGFTAVTDRLESGRGEAGIEDVIDVLNRCFKAVIEEATDFGGEVATVTGDGLVILWPCAAPDSDPDPLPELIAASRCALGILDRTRKAGAVDESHFAVKIGIGVGQVFIGELESNAVRGQLLIAGPLITDLFASCAVAERGQAVVAESARHLVPGEFRSRLLPQGGLALDAVTGESDATAVPARPEARGPLDHRWIGRRRCPRSSTASNSTGSPSCALRR